MQKRNVDPRQRKQARYEKKNRRKKQRRRVILGVLLAAVGLAAAGGLERKNSFLFAGNPANPG